MKLTGGRKNALITVSASDVDVPKRQMEKHVKWDVGVPSFLWWKHAAGADV